MPTRKLRSHLYDSLRKIVPVYLRNWMKRQTFFRLIIRIFGNSVYSSSYYDDIEGMEGDSVTVIAEWISKNLKPAKIIDVVLSPR